MHAMNKEAKGCAEAEQFCFSNYFPQLLFGEAKETGEFEEVACRCQSAKLTR